MYWNYSQIRTFLPRSYRYKCYSKSMVVIGSWVLEIDQVEEKICNICISFVLRLWISIHRCLPYNYYYVCTVTCCMEEVKMCVSDCSFHTFTTTFVEVWTRYKCKYLTVFTIQLLILLYRYVPVRGKNVRIWL